MLIGRGEFVIKEIEALYMLRKYRSLKKSYYEEPPIVAVQPEETSKIKPDVQQTKWNASCYMFYLF